ncbi:hypothetical protein JCM13210_12500 [Thermaerobacter litoralis]
MAFSRSSCRRRKVSRDAISTSRSQIMAIPPVGPPPQGGRPFRAHPPGSSTPGGIAPARRAGVLRRLPGRPVGRGVDVDQAGQGGVDPAEAVLLDPPHPDARGVQEGPQGATSCLQQPAGQGGEAAGVDGQQRFRAPCPQGDDGVGRFVPRGGEGLGQEEAGDGGGETRHVAGHEEAVGVRHGLQAGVEPGQRPLARVAVQDQGPAQGAVPAGRPVDHQDLGAGGGQGAGDAVQEGAVGGGE